MSSHIKIYTTYSCPYCVKAKSFFSRNSLRYEEVDLTNNYEEIDRLKEKTGHRTVPLIFVDGVFVGGYSDMIEKINNGQLTLKN